MKTYFSLLAICALFFLGVWCGSQLPPKNYSQQPAEAIERQTTEIEITLKDGKTTTVQALGCLWSKDMLTIYCYEKENHFIFFGTPQYAYEERSLVFSGQATSWRVKEK